MKYHSPLISLITARLLKIMERALVYIKEKMKTDQGAAHSGINNANAKRVHKNRLHHLTKQENKSNRVVV